MPDGGFVQNPIRLGAGGPHCGALGAVQDAKLNARCIGCQRHGTAQSIHLSHQMAFANAANGRVATHLPQRLDVVTQQQGAAAHAGAGQRRFGASMAAANHNHIKLLGVKHQSPL